MADEHLDDKVQDITQYYGLWVATRAEDKELTYTSQDIERFLSCGKNPALVLDDATRQGYGDCNILLYKDPAKTLPKDVDMSQYYGFWVAAPTFRDKTNVVASGKDIKEVHEQARGLGYEDPVIYFCRDPSIPFYPSA